jgi:hypothetical protein
MQRRLSNGESRQRYAEARKLWNDFDPIGVVADGDGVDEYDNYIGPSLRLAIEGKSVEEFEEYIRWVVHDRIGLRETERSKEVNGRFAREFIEWYRANWPDTAV